MKKVFLFLAILCVANTLGIGLKDRNKFRLGWCSLAKFEILDTTEFIVTYNLSFLQDTLHPLVRSDIVILQAGKRVTKFYGLKAYMTDLSVTKRAQGKTWTEEDKKRFQSAGDGMVDYEIFFNLQSDTLISVHHIPFKNDYVIRYTERAPKLAWVLTENKKMILDYPCWQAITSYGGRTWQAWYTPSIPHNVGPWKSSGLPGLILQLQDEQKHYVFTGIEITNAREPIKYYQRPTREWTKEKWQIFNKRAHLNPLATFNEDGQTTFHQFDVKNRTQKILDETWTIPYNPIERE